MCHQSWLCGSIDNFKLKVTEKHDSINFTCEKCPLDSRRKRTFLSPETRNEHQYKSAQTNL